MTTSRRVSLVVRALLAAAACYLVLPASFGGPFSQVTTHGISMAPRFHTGDLALVRQAGTYRVGDVVAYRSDTLHTVVLHRIIAVEGDRYTFQGDNNAWIDPERPTRAQLIGRLAVRIPQGGVWLRRATGPSGLAAIAFALVASGGAVTTRRRKRRGTVGRHAARRRWTVAGTPRPMLRTAALATGAVALTGGALGALAWGAPLHRPATTTDHVARSMTFSYAASVRRSPAYDGTTVTSPNPVFRKLTDTVDVRFAYAGRPGTVTVAAELSTQGGWHSTVPLAPRTTFTGGRYDGSVRLDLARLAARAKAAAAVTGLPGEQVDVSVVPTVESAGLPAFVPSLHLSLDALRLALPAGSKLTAADSTALTRSTTEAGTFHVLRFPVGVAAGRRVATGLLALSLLAAALLAALWRRSSGDDEGATIRRRYASLLVAVQPMPAPSGRPVVEVTSFATLARLAERYGLLVLHWSRSDVETFVVQDESTTYRYRTGSAARTEPVPAVTESTVS
jgi:signal peptidase I